MQLQHRSVKWPSEYNYNYVELFGRRVLSSEISCIEKNHSRCAEQYSSYDYSSQGGLDGVNAFHCRSCYMYSGTGTYSTAVQVPVPQLYGFLTVYF